MEETKKPLLSISTPLAILIAGVLIALAIVYVGKAEGQPSVDLPIEKPLAAVRPVSAEDHLFGSPDAEIAIIEYSDLECPFCAQIHKTLRDIVTESNGEVAWVYRHFPLASIHAHALPAALAAECIAAAKGNEAFWAFVESMFAAGRLGDSLYRATGEALGVASSELDACMAAKTYEAKVRADFDEAIASGGNGTPYIVLQRKDGESASFSGALPKAYIEQIIADLKKR